MTTNSELFGPLFKSELFKKSETSQRHIDRLLSVRSLHSYIREAWPILEPAEPFVDGWVLGAICEHLTAVTDGQIRYLLINVPPGTTKSMSTCVFWPSWEWGPQNMPSLRYLTFSYSGGLTTRDNERARFLMESEEYQTLWGHNFRITNEAVNLIENSKRGWRMASSVGGKTTGYRANRLIIDDPHNIIDGESEIKRAKAVKWFRESLSSRMSNIGRDTVVVIMQRVHESDVSGEILAKEMGYTHLCIPMEYEAARHCVTNIGWTDPRGCYPGTTERMGGNALAAAEGEICWLERFPPAALAKLKRDMDEYAVAGQLQQAPTVRGGAIIKADYWKDWPPYEVQEQLEASLPADSAGTIKPDYPMMDYIIACLDTAYKEKQTNDLNAITVWGVWRGSMESRILPHSSLSEGLDGSLRLPSFEGMKVMLMYAWQRRVPIHGPDEVRPGGLTDAEWNSPRWLAKRQETWGLVEWTNHIARQFRVSTLLIEDKTRGNDVRNELFRLVKNMPYGVVMVDPKSSDKVMRANALVHLWSNGVIYAPVVYQNGEWGYPIWAQACIDQFTIFPRGAHDDMVDTGLYAIKHLRDHGFALRTEESQENAEEDAMAGMGRPPAKLYDV